MPMDLLELIRPVETMDILTASAAATGIALHQLFRLREPNILGAVFTVASADAALYALLKGPKMGRATLSILCWITGTSVASLLLSMAVYRLSPWHPLAHIPGPTTYKLTRLRTVLSSWRGTHYTAMKRLHTKYGPIVRMGPNAISIVDVGAVSSVLGASGLPKDHYYRARHPPTADSLLVMTGTAHAHRRRIWNRGLGQETLPIHARAATAGVERLRQQLDKLADGQTCVNMTDWIRLYGFDFMGEFAFGKEFGLVQAGTDSIGVWRAIQRFLVAHDIVGHLPWLGIRAAFIPGLVTALIALRNFARKCVQDRLKRPATTLDLWYYLGTEDSDGAGRLRPDELAADGTLALVAGSDTSASAMVCTLFFLLSNPDSLAKARTEIDAVVANGMTPWASADDHGALPFMNACIDESLRLMPVVPTNGSRCVPIGSGGKHIAGYFIPEDTEVFVSPYQLHRDPRYFSPKTEEYRPERWLEPGWITTRDAFIPFSAGPSQCVGKNLARIEIIIALTALLRNYDIAFAPGFRAESFLDQVTEHIVIDVPSLPVLLTRRV
ncbi:cytochrome P450 [Exidia glandulosa HHB12029]|uniref:Cytochrome P450 n=1 Tax=Exidia glandulosa HHB12029 TaxID=1314781 RepID=A0A165EJC2_EXIGL|nr:cytochrome P450 [Exidia glandulosa HHB12029]